MKKIKDSGLFWLILITLAIVSLMMLPYWLGNYPFEYGGDLKPTYFPYYSEFRLLMGNLVRGEGLPFYSWNLFLGNNFYSSKSFYILGDIYYYISLFFNTHFYNIFTIQTILKIAVSTSSFYWLARVFNYGKKTSIILGLCYGFSSWIMFFLGQPMFISAYSFLPLFIIGIEKYLRNSKITVFLISTALVLFTNYYMFFALSFFAPFYFWARYYAIKGEFKGWFKSALKLVGVYIVGVMITAILILPAFMYIIQNDRVGTMYFDLTFDQIQIYFHQLQAMFIPSQKVIYQVYNIFETGSHVSRELCMWAGSITSLLVFQLFTDKDRAYKRAMLCLYAVLFILFITPTGNMVMLGFSSPSFRWVYIIIILNLIVSGKYLSDLSLIHKKNLIVSCILIVLICLLNMPVYLFVTNQMSIFMDNIGMYTLALTSAAFFIGFTLILLSKSKYKLYLIIALSVCELSYYNVGLIGYDRINKNSTWEFIDRATSVLESYPNELNNYLDGLDDENYSSYYRVFVPHESLYWSYSHNHNLHYELQGVMTYDSTYAPSFNDMKMIAPQVKDFNSDWIFNIEDADLINFLNVKYAIVIDKSELPHSNFTLVNDSYRGSLLVYENDMYRDVGTTYTKTVTYEAFMQDQLSLDILMDTVLCHSEDFEEISSLIGNEVVSLKNIDYHNNYFYGSAETNEEGFMVISLPYDEGWEIKVNNEVVKVYKVNGGMMGIALEDGFNEVVMNFTPSGFNAGMIISVIGITIGSVLIFFDNKKKK